MEYIKVTASIEDGRTLSYIDDEGDKVLPVLINKEKNGFIDTVLTVEPGYVTVSVDLSNLRGVDKAQERLIEVGGTTPDTPMEIAINVT